MSTWYYASCVYDEIRAVVNEGGLDALFGPDVRVNKGVDLVPKILIRQTDVKRVYLPLWMFVFQCEAQVSAKEAHAGDQNSEVGVVGHLEL
jgi:hypothetical protein